MEKTKIPIYGKENSYPLISRNLMIQAMNDSPCSLHEYYNNFKRLKRRDGGNMRIYDSSEDDIYYSYYSTILAYGLNEQELITLNKCIENLSVYDKLKGKETKIKLYFADVLEDIFGIPHFLAFINFAVIDHEDKYKLFQFWKECEEPLPPELAEFEDELKDLKNPTTYIINSSEVPDYSIQNIYFKENIFSDPEKLRLTILSVIKDNEGVGRRACESSIRLRRVLLMYKYLLKGEVLTKERLDEMLYPDTISKRMFYRDLRIINEIEEGKVVFDKNLKGYVLKG